MHRARDHSDRHPARFGAVTASATFTVMLDELKQYGIEVSDWQYSSPVAGVSKRSSPPTCSPQPKKFGSPPSSKVSVRVSAGGYRPEPHGATPPAPPWSPPPTVGDEDVEDGPVPPAPSPSS